MFTSLKEKWEAYVGPKDERLEALSNRYYARLARSLIVCASLCVYYDNALRRAASMFDESFEQSALANTVPTGMLLSLALATCCVLYVSRINKQGIVDINRFAETDTFPLGYFALCSALGAAAVALGIFAVESFAQVQFVGIQGTYWAANAAMGLFYASIIFPLCLLVSWFDYRSAKRNRKRIELELED